MLEWLVVGEGCPGVLYRIDYYRSLLGVNGSKEIQLQGKVGKLGGEYGEYGEYREYRE